MSYRIALLLGLILAAPSRVESRPPNIVFVFIDDMGYADPSCFGNPYVTTKSLDRLAREGIRLENFYVNSPICSPSRVAVTTGQYPGRWRIHSFLESRKNNRRRGMRDFLDAAAPTTARKLRSAGYATAHFGKWHMGGGRDVDDAPLPSSYGFDESYVAFEGLGDRLLTNPRNSSARLGRGKVDICKPWEKTERYVDRAISFARRHRDRPFFIRVFPNDVHDRHVPAPGSEQKWRSVTDNPWEWAFFAVLEELDRQIGRLVDEIDALGLSKDTLFVFTSDNGPTDWRKYYRDDSGGPPGFTGPFFGRKWSLFEGGIRMPFIARWKGKIPAGAVDRTSVMSAIDLSPTLCRLAGVSIPETETLDGVDLSAVLLGRPRTRPTPLFWQYGAPHANLRPGRVEHQSPSFAIRDGAWKLLINANGSEARLFNLQADPGESRNLLSIEKRRARALQAKIAGWARDVGYEFDGSAAPTVPIPSVGVSINRQLIRFRNRGVVTRSPGHWDFSGRAWLDLPRSSAPSIAGKRWLRVRAKILTKSPSGVVLAHGGDRYGYSVYLAEGRLCFATCVDWKRTVIRSEAKLPPGAHEIDAFQSRDGGLLLKVDGELVARGKAPGSIGTNPGDSVQIGADLIKPVGDYEVPNSYRGTIEHLSLDVER